MIGPACSPFISGFVSKSSLGWRMAIWIGAIIAGLSLIAVAWCPETFAPVILLHKAQKLRAEGVDKDAYAPVELEDRSLKSIITTAISRPFRLFFQKGVVFFTSLFLSLLYGTFYLFFQVCSPPYESLVSYMYMRGLRRSGDESRETTFAPSGLFCQTDKFPLYSVVQCACNHELSAWNVQYH